MTEFRERVADALALYADELPVELEAPAAALYDEWVALSLALARGVLSGAGSTRWFDPVAADAAGLRWGDLLELGRGLRVDGLEGRFERLVRHPASPEVVRLLLAWLRELGERARGGDDAIVRELGGLHEIFLGLGFECLPRAARRLRRSRIWLSPEDVLTWPASVRSKRLQRELGLSKHSVHAFGASLARAQTVAAVEQALASLFDPRVAPRAAGRCVLQASGMRRTSGAHYTPWPLCLELCERVLAPLVRALPEPRSESLLALRVCDPAMGAGAFLMAATRYLADALLEAWRREGRAPAGPEPLARAAARHAIATRVLRGVDKNPTAVSLARRSLELLLGADTPLAELDAHLRAGDALLGTLDPEAPARAQASALDWRSAFPDVFQRPDPGFDAVIGNPPWVAYVGRAAQPLEPELAAFYAATNPAFKRYRTLHGLFVYRSAELLRRGGRLGLVLPTSVADLAGYSATRAAHDTLCSVDTELPDWGDGAFDGVFQPCMALLSTRRAAPSAALAGVWPLRNDELGPAERRLLERLSHLPRLPREAFGERGFQTTEDDLAHLRRAPAAHPPHTFALREGADVGEFLALPPQLFADPAKLERRLRPPADWQAVKLLIRQTARFPLAAFSDGQAFRNSILAGFDSPGCSAALLLGLLNSQLFRWLHYTQQRDARQGMPQLKVGHLRALPAPPLEAARACAAIEALAQRLGARNTGVDAALRAELDVAVADAFGLDAAERQLVASWASQHPAPASRRRPPSKTAPQPTPPSAHGAWRE